MTPDLRPLFEPEGVLVAGVSTHPGKFGFVALHNVLASGYRGRVLGTNREGATVLGVKCHRDVTDIPAGAADVVVVCTPAEGNEKLLRTCAARGIRAAFVCSAGYGESGPDGREAEAELAALADELGIALAGPNGQGLVSTPVSLCAQIAAPYPPAGSIAVASQSGNLSSAFLNLARQTAVGISRSVSVGNAAALGIGDFLAWFSRDPHTRVSIAYLEDVAGGRHLASQLMSAAAAHPVVVLKGGRTAEGQRAAASHTGSLASDDAVFGALCRQSGVTAARSVEHAFDVAATFATQPLPRGNRVAIVTTVGGWGVLTADAVARSSLCLAELPVDLVAALDAVLPPRWSRSNPIDLAGGETRDTVPLLLETVAAHPGVDAVVFLGLGIQSNQAALLRSGPFHPAHGLDRIVDFHERQDARYAEAAARISAEVDKPILVATELATASPDNPGPASVRASGRLCYPSGERAVDALDALWRRARWLDRRAGSDPQEN